jgi:hypothetical protein
MTRIEKPGANEYGPHDEQYVGLVPGDGELLKHLEDNLEAAKKFFRSVPEPKLVWRYAEGKWTVKEILGHIIDTERVYAYRALRFSRNDATELPGFEQDDYVKVSRSNERSIDDMLDELTAVRASSIALLKSLDDDAFMRSGVASGRRLSVRGAAYIMAGHQLHHMNIIKERYL